MICVGCVGNRSGEVAFCARSRFDVVYPVVYVVVCGGGFFIDITVVVCRLVRVCNVAPPSSSSLLSSSTSFEGFYFALAFWFVVMQPWSVKGGSESYSTSSFFVGKGI